MNIEKNQFSSISNRSIVILLILHILLGWAGRSSPLLSTIHAYLTLSVGIFYAAISKDQRKVSFVAAYITGAEVFWRMTNANIFWEAGKYFIVLIFLVALLRMKGLKRASLPILFFLLLCISIPITISAIGVTPTSQQLLSFNLSGPLALLASVLYFSQISFDETVMVELIWWVIFPIISIATIISSGIGSLSDITFSNNSNFVTSGGFGPNQVSAILGLGGALCILGFIVGKNRFKRSLSLFLIFIFLVFSALTFSRGGVYNAGLVLFMALAHSIRNSRTRFGIIFLSIIFGVVGGYVVFPQLNDLTGGMLGARFQNLDTTGRVEIAQADLDLFVANPLLGVGPGLSPTDRVAIIGYLDDPHTEYTRILAEHGIAGLIAIIMLILMVSGAYKRAPDLAARTWVASLLAWPIMEMSHAAMRIVAISFIFGLAMVNWDTGKIENKNIVPKNMINRNSKRKDSSSNVDSKQNSLNND